MEFYRYRRRFPRTSRDPTALLVGPDQAPNRLDKHADYTTNTSLFEHNLSSDQRGGQENSNAKGRALPLPNWSSVRPGCLSRPLRKPTQSAQCKGILEEREGYGADMARVASRCLPYLVEFALFGNIKKSAEYPALFAFPSHFLVSQDSSFKIAFSSFLISCNSRLLAGASCEAPRTGAGAGAGGTGTATGGGAGDSAGTDSKTEETV